MGNPAFAALEPLESLMDKCVHCGFCLPACPSYALLGQEMDSPRGRIYLMRAAIEDRVEMTSSVVQHFDTCLGCMACETACPSGVRYAPLIEATRAAIEGSYRRPLSERLLRRILFAILPYPARLRALSLPLAVLHVFRRRPTTGRPRSNGANDAGQSEMTAAAPARFDVSATEAADLNDRSRRTPGGRLWETVRAFLTLAPPVKLSGIGAETPERTAPIGEPRLRVGLLTGCVQRAFFGDVNRATARVLAAAGCEVVAPREQGCCGALALHAGEDNEARGFARRLIAAFEANGVEQVVVNAAGCGSAMKEYGHLLKDDPAWADRARAFAARVRDVTEVLAALEPGPSPRRPLQLRVAYHDACHLAHAQGVRREPRLLLESIPGVTVVPIGESEMCCGSAGIFNLVQPEMAEALGRRKAAHIDAAAPDLVVTSNPGCILQLRAAARQRGDQYPVVHIVELLDAALSGECPPEWNGGGTIPNPHHASGH